MASDPTLLFIKASAVDNLLPHIPEDCPSWRGTSIQNAKLHRMLTSFMEKHEKKLGSRKDYGEDVRRLYRQQKAMQACLNKLLEEYWLKTNQGTRKSFRKDLQKLNIAFDAMVYMSMQTYKKKLRKLVGPARIRNLKS
jgi:arginyl-tRNA synthetase